MIIATAKALPLEGYRKIASFAEREGVYVSAATVYRVLREEGLILARKCRSKVAGEMCDRLLHRSPTVNIWGGSYGLREKCKAGILSSNREVMPAMKGPGVGNSAPPILATSRAQLTRTSE